MTGQEHCGQTETCDIPAEHRKHFFTQMVVEHWQRLPRKATVSPSLEIVMVLLGNLLCLTPL